MSEKIGKEAQETFAIHTVTMSFNAMEDRIAMDSADQKGQIERLWLSRRLLDKLIPTLADQLEVNSNHQIPTELEQSLAQEKAELDKKHSEAVKVEARNPSWLVTSVQVGRNENEFQLLFLGENDFEPSTYSNQARFDLAIPNLRQWLNAVYQIYLKAEWETKAFPRWINDKNLQSDKPFLIN